MASRSLVWFRLDLRLADQPALMAAATKGNVIPVFIWSPEEEGPAAPGAASRWWLHESLNALDQSLRKKGSRLILRRGPALSSLQALLEETGAKSVYWNRRYEPSLIARDTKVKDALQSRGIYVESFNSALLFEPWQIKTKAGTPFQVFTPFWNACMGGPEPSAPLVTPTQWASPSVWPKSEPLESFGLLPKPDWAGGLRSSWDPGEAGGRERLKVFSSGPVGQYHEARDVMSEDGVSRLSPHLHFGEISPRQIWSSMQRDSAVSFGNGPATYLKELGWREFSHHLLYHFPQTVSEPLRPEFAQFPWRRDHAAFEAWSGGHTGFPVVDAGMRELWRTGWMHNRARMICASFLVKDLLVDWRQGAAWFWDTLVDADLANNTLGWQWTAGCGADAAPFFRIFNPVLQGQKFDSKGEYVRRWVPELATFPVKNLHDPWLAKDVQTKVAYPPPLVDHGFARDRALAALATVSKKGKFDA